MAESIPSYFQKPDGPPHHVALINLSEEERAEINLPDFCEISLINLSEEERAEINLPDFCEIWTRASEIDADIELDMLIYHNDQDLADHLLLCGRLSPTGLGIVKNLSDEPHAAWWAISNKQYLKTTRGQIGFFQKRKDFHNFRIAVLICGLTRKWKESADNMFENLYDRALGVDFDFYLYTWDRDGDYAYEGKDFEKPLEENYVSKDRFDNRFPYYIKQNYKPVADIGFHDYTGWSKDIKEQFDNFIKRHHIEDEPLRIWNGIFAQYFQVYSGFKMMEYWAQRNKQTYDLVIRTRYDLEVCKPRQCVNWTKLVDIGQHKIISLEQWDRFGMRGNWIAGSWDLMQSYSELYLKLDEFSEEQIKSIKLASIHVPKYIFNYFFSDGTDPEKTGEEEIFARSYSHLQAYINEFISDPNNLSFHGHC